MRFTKNSPIKFTPASPKNTTCNAFVYPLNEGNKDTIVSLKNNNIPTAKMPVLMTGADTAAITVATVIYLPLNAAFNAL